MIGDMESELTESSEINSKTEHLAVTVQVDFDEAIPIYLKSDRKTQAFQKTINSDIQISIYLKKE